MQPESQARAMSRAMRDYLVEHVHGPCPINHARGAPDSRTRTALLARGLIRCSGLDPHATTPLARPTHTHATPLGRAVTAYLLASYAELLVNLGYGVVAPREYSAPVPLTAEELKVYRARQGRPRKADPRMTDTPQTPTAPDSAPV